MHTQYSHRPFADEYTGSPVTDSLNTLFTRGSSAFNAGIAVTAALVAVFAH